MDSLESSITTGGLERAGRVADVFGQAFQDDPTARYILGKLDEERKNRYLSNFLLFAARAAALNGGTLEEASDYLSCAAYVPPGRRIDNPRTLVRAGMLGIAASIGPTGLWRLLLEFGSLADKAKARGMPGVARYHYLFVIGTLKQGRGKGLASAIIRKYQARARQDSLPLWLESSTTHSRDIYAALGFEVVEEIQLGRGKVNADGYKDKAGDGVTLWAMVWWPPKPGTDSGKEAAAHGPAV